MEAPLSIILNMTVDYFYNNICVITQIYLYTGVFIMPLKSFAHGKIHLGALLAK